MDASYRKYDEDDIPLSVPKRPLVVPIDYMELYCLRDARVPEVESDTYQNSHFGYDVLSGYEENSQETFYDFLAALRLSISKRFR